MQGRRVWPWAAVVAGVLIAACGLLGIGTYLWSAVLDRIGEPDQSLIFWYLPILAIGIVGLGVGLGALAIGVNRLRHTKREEA